MLEKSLTCEELTFIAVAIMPKHEFFKTVKTIVEKMICIQPGEEVVIVVDGRTPLNCVEILANFVYAADAKPVLLVIPAPLRLGKGAYPVTTPPKSAAATVRMADVLIDLALCYTDCVLDLLKAGKRCCVLGPAHDLSDMLIRTVGSVDVDKLKDEADRFRDLWSGANTARITSKEGTDISLDIRDIDGIAWNGFCRPEDKERWVPLPAAVPGIIDYVRAEGTIVSDGFLQYDDDIHIPKEPVSVSVRNGKVDSIRGGRNAEYLQSYLKEFNDPNVYLGPVHVNVGTNPNARLNPNPELERYRGSLSIAFGDNTFLSEFVYRPRKSEPVKASGHWDVQVLRPTLYLDDKPVIEDGSIRI